MKSLNPKITDWKARRVWIIGASSGIGEALARALRLQGAQLAISARRENQLRQIASEDDIILPLDVSNPDTLTSAYGQLRQSWDEIDLVVYCAGVFAPMRAWEIDLQQVNGSISTNLTGVYNLLHTVVPDLIRQGRGGLCLVSSVAGYTGLPKALAYGPAKAALINLAQILHADLSPKGIGIYLVNPGFVDTRLTKQNDFKMPALISSDEAALEITHGLGNGRFETHFPKRFTFWMRLLSRLPDRLRFHLMKRAVTS